MKDDTQLARWLAGELDDKELQELKDSPRYATLLRIKENFAKIEKPTFNDEAMLENILQQEKQPVKTLPLYRRYKVYAVAACAILFIALGFIFTMPETMEASNGKTLAFTLPDASSVILNSGSNASYRDWNWDNNRTIALNGEAYFRVAKGQKFSVTTSLGTVTVLGTQFNVKARNGRFDVICYEGRVSVGYNGKQTILTPHQAVTIDEGKKIDEISQDVTANEPEWLNDELAFTHENFKAIIAEIERKYDVTISTEYDSQQNFTGSLPANDLERALKTVALSYHLDIEKQGKTIILKPINAKR